VTVDFRVSKRFIVPIAPSRIRKLRAGSVDFAASGMPLDDAQLAQLCRFITCRFSPAASNKASILSDNGGRWRNSDESRILDV
jgi:hypothetical protein